MKKLKVVTIVGTRPEIIRLSRLIPKLDEHTEHILVHTGQNYDPMLSDVFFKDLELRQPDHYLNVDTTSFGTVMGDVIKKSEEILLKENPDAVMILGDTNSSIAAIVAERLHIPVYHMEAGNRSFDNNVPEELNRRMIDHVATFNLPYNLHSLRNLLSEGKNARFVYMTGSPMGEIFSTFQEKIAASNVVEDLGISVGSYFLASFHRQENVDRPERLSAIIECLEAVSEEWDLPVLVSTHPRTKQMLQKFGLGISNRIIFHEPFGYVDFNSLQLLSKCVISDSGTVSEESAILGFSAVSIRESTERPEAVEGGAIMLSGIDPTSLLRCIKLALGSRGTEHLPDGYEVQDFSERVLKILFSTSGQYRQWKGLL